MSRQTHRNGVECTHGAFLHEECKDCRIEELEAQVAKQRVQMKGIIDLGTKQQATIERVRVKCKRWQKQIDDGYDPRNPVVQAARDETLQMVVNAIQAILEDE